MNVFMIKECDFFVFAGSNSIFFYQADIITNSDKTLKFLIPEKGALLGSVYVFPSFKWVYLLDSLKIPTGNDCVTLVPVELYKFVKICHTL